MLNELWRASVNGLIDNDGKWPKPHILGAAHTFHFVWIISYILHIISLLTGDMNSINWPLLIMCGFIAQLVEHRTGIAEVTDSNPVEALIFSGVFFPIAWGRSRPLLLRISSAHAIHWSRACHIIFKCAHRCENSTKHRADDLCVNLVCEYFCWMLGDPHFFFRQITSFSDSFHHTKKQKKSVCGKF